MEDLLIHKTQGESIAANPGKTYDAAIIGGGLAGLSLAIQLSRLNYSVIVFEKEQFPFHKVCGEYISMESKNFLQSLGMDLDNLNLPVISKLVISAKNGKLLKHNLSLGSYGISRYLLDDCLAQIAVTNGTILMQNTRVNDVYFENEIFNVHTSGGQYNARIVFGSYGKRSNLDVKWKRPFITTSKNSLNNLIGIKYHIKTNFPADTIALHNFQNGYCGIVKIENDTFNLCYLTTADNLKNAGGQIKKMEETVLSQNPHLKKIFGESEMLFQSPLTISQISFDKKKQVEDHVLMMGDAAGMITPLCGNGMSMALHGSKLAAEQVQAFLNGKISRKQMEERYAKNWQQQFARRLFAGRNIQRLFNHSSLTGSFISMVRPFPGIVDYLVRQTHGEPF